VIIARMANRHTEFIPGQKSADWNSLICFPRSPFGDRETKRLDHCRGRNDNGSYRARKWKPIRDEGEECD
jgi:hypothetical protein